MNNSTSKHSRFVLCKAAAKTATSRQIVGLLNGGQPDKDFFHVRPDGFQTFLQVLNASFVDAAGFIGSFMVKKYFQSAPKDALCFFIYRNEIRTRLLAAKMKSDNFDV